MNDHMDNRPDRNRNNPGNQGPNKNHQSILAFVICLLITLVYWLFSVVSSIFSTVSSATVCVFVVSSSASEAATILTSPL